MTNALPANTLEGYFTQKAGKLTPTAKLETLYQAISQKLFAGKEDHHDEPPSQRPDAFLLYVAGGNGVGKSTWLEVAKARGVVPGKDAPNAVYMLNQFFKDTIPEMLEIYNYKNPPSDASKRLAKIKERDDAYWFKGGEALGMYLMTRLTHEAYERGLTVVFDSQMAYKDQHLAMIEDAKAHGYPAIQVGVFIDPENYPKRIFKRLREQGRPTEFRTHLSRHGKFAQLFCEWEQSPQVVQAASDTQRFDTAKKPDARPCYLDLFDVSILTSNNLDMEEMKEGDFAYHVVSVARKGADGKVSLSIKSPEEYQLLRTLSRIDAAAIRDDWNEAQLTNYVQSVKKLGQPPVGTIAVNDSLTTVHSPRENMPIQANTASDKLVSFVQRVLGGGDRDARKTF